MNVAGSGAGLKHTSYATPCEYNGSHKTPSDFDFSGIDEAIKKVENSFDKDYGIKTDIGAAASQLLAACNYTEVIDLSESIYNVLTETIDDAKTEVGNISAAVREEAARIIEEEEGIVNTLNSEDRIAQSQKIAEEYARQQRRNLGY